MYRPSLAGLLFVSTAASAAEPWTGPPVIEVRIDDVQKAGEVIAKAIGSGAAAVHGVRFEMKDRKPLEREALKNAVEDARARADAAAAGAGTAVTGIIRIEEAGMSATAPPMYERGMKAAMADAAPETPIAAGELEIRAGVTLTVALR